MEQAPVSADQSPEQKEYIIIQLAIIRSMIRRGIIKTAMDYVERGHAEAFEMFWNGDVRCATDKEVLDMSNQIRELISPELLSRLNMHRQQ